MATLAERIESDYKTAMKAQERLRIDTLRLIKAASQRVAMEKRKDVLDEPELIQVLQQQAKQRRETIEAAKRAARQDVVAQATAELDILNAYLPQALAPEALKQLIEEALKAVGPNHGQMMKFVMGKSGGAVDGKTVHQLVSERLKQGTKA